MIGAAALSAARAAASSEAAASVVSAQAQREAWAAKAQELTDKVKALEASVGKSMYLCTADIRC